VGVAAGDYAIQAEHAGFETQVRDLDKPLGSGQQLENIDNQMDPTR
jgi:hypothetical protein